MFNPSKTPQPGRVPQGVYKLMVHGAKSRTAQSGSKGIELAVEIMSPEAVEVDGISYPTVGIKGPMTFWCTDKNMPSVVAALTNIGLPPIDKEYNTVDDYIADTLTRVDAEIVGKIITSEVRSTQEAVLGADKKPVVGPDGQPIMRAHRVDFNIYGILPIPAMPANAPF